MNYNYNRNRNFNRLPKSNYMGWVVGAFVIIIIAVGIYLYLGSISEESDAPDALDAPDFPIQIKGNLSSNKQNITLKNINNTSSTLCFHGKCPTGDTCAPQTESVILEVTEDEFKTEGTFNKDFDNGYQINWKIGDSSCDDFFAGLN